MPLFYEEEEEVYDEEKDYKNLEKEVQTVLYGEGRAGKGKKEGRKMKHRD